jgi:glutamate dehydrogenase
MQRRATGENAPQTSPEGKTGAPGGTPHRPGGGPPAGGRHIGTSATGRHSSPDQPASPSGGAERDFASGSPDRSGGGDFDTGSSDPSVADPRPPVGQGRRTTRASVAGEVTEDTELDEPLPDAERLIGEAVALAGDDLDSAQLVRRYWRFAPDEELVGLTPAEMLAAARAHRELAEQRVPGQLKLRVGETADGELTTLEIVVDDMPFLVDTVTAALATRRLAVHLLVHPLVVVRRAPLGKLTEVCPEVEADDAIAGDIVESWMRLEIDRVREEGERDALRRTVQRVLTDVREAVEDWPRMRSAALRLADELAGVELPVPDRDVTDSVELLRWLVDGHFTFLGYREYALVDGELRAVLGTGLGILRADQQRPRTLTSMTPEAQAKVMEKRLLVITKANSRSTVHRNAYLDYIGIKTFDVDGNVNGEKRFLGLFSSAAYLSSVRELPVVRRKVNAVLDRSGLSPRSHSGRDLLTVLEDYPRDELFQITTNDLADTVFGVLRLAGRRQLRLFVRKDAYGRFISCLVFLPRDRFTTANRLAIQDILLRELHGIGVDYATRVGESPLARIHFIVRTDPAQPPAVIDVEDIQRQLTEATRNWDDDFKLVMERKLGEEQTRYLFDRYATAFPDSYKDEHTPYEAVKDIAKLELLDEPGQLAMHVYRRRKDDRDVRFKVYRHSEPMILSAVLPVLHSLGVQVVDERPYQVRREDATVHLYDFGLALPSGALDIAEVRPHVENAFSAAWRGEAEVDGFNELVVRAGLTWRQVVILRAYAKYLRQAGTVYSQESMEGTFIAYPELANRLVELFEARFAPAIGSDEERELRAKELVTAINQALDGVSSLDQDRIVRAYLTLVQATVRTSFFQRSEGRPKSYVAFKLAARSIPELPAPRPQHEIFVYSPRFEGVHLRFGAVARGGLRWSDRRDDFRTEILGLVKAQMVKNAVIVPAGAKGGFVLKQPPPASDREAFQREGVACYKLFIQAMLDVTDNLVDGSVKPPAEVVRHDADDPYLVVAADKGTASFSDFANEISLSNGFWLGDAFASGGSAGYDHKKMGITARGAWESVKRHFRELASGNDEHGRELGKDIQAEDFTVVGVGDMSGDVFGNGMLLSEHTRLVAAFDHRHIFVDPDPDPASSYAERRRLFDLPRSSWADYDTSKISAGGGVWPRTAKSIELSAAARAALGLPEGAAALTPAELMKAILQAPVDLLWNGGIGTYVKAASESQLDVGDKANDAIRVNGKDLRARVVGEGGNLGLTQRGRIEYAMAGGRICTDFIDNSAGVDTSDHEVNIKILLSRSDLTTAGRDELLATMTDEVAELVLRDNYQQATALGNARAQAHPLLPVHRRLLSELERAGRLDRTIEAMPTDEELAARFAAGGGLTSPEFAVLLAYVKIALEDELHDSAVPDEAWTHPVLVDYFPTALRDYEELMTAHRLRREIVTTQLVNETVNRGGTSFVFRAMEETGASAADVIRAYVVVREVFGLADLWARVEALDNVVPTAAQTTLYLAVRRLLDRAVRWLVTLRRPSLDVTAEIARLRPGVSRLLPQLDTLLRGEESAALLAHRDRLVRAGIPEDLALEAGRLTYSFGLLDVVACADATGRDVQEVAGVYFVLSERFKVDALLTKITALPRDDRWQTLARMALRYDLYASLAALTLEVLAGSPSAERPDDRVAHWEQTNAAAIAQSRNAIGEFGDSPGDLAALSVLLRQIRTLVSASAS